MAVAAKCPSCSAPLSETSIMALAPICDHCGVVITSTGGTLGLTGVYGVSDNSITRRRVEADLAVFREYHEKYRGMKEACLQQLNWGKERYAKLPSPPELLPLKAVASVWEGLSHFGWLLLGATLWYYVGATFCYVMISLLLAFLSALGIVPDSVDETFRNAQDTPYGPLHLFHIGPPIFIFLVFIWIEIEPVVANGRRPLENARRKKTYEDDVAAALKAAEPLKLAEDHRLRCQIRELESLSQTVETKEAEVRRLLASL